MKRLLAVLLALSMNLAGSGCGNVFVGGAIHPGFSTINGTVSFVGLDTIVANGTVIEVTVVSFLQNSVSSSLSFCGDQSNQFPLHQTVTTNFTPGKPCATLVEVVIIF
jgi:hypothetical protein